MELATWFDHSDSKNSTGDHTQVLVLSHFIGTIFISKQSHFLDR